MKENSHCEVIKYLSCLVCALSEAKGMIKFMIKKNVKKEIDKIIKEVWINDICKDYGRGSLIKETSLQCSLYHHLQNEMDSILEENNLYIYPEFYFKNLKYYADLAIVEMNMSDGSFFLGDRITDVAAIIELKYSGGNAKTTEDYIKTDKAKLREYTYNLSYDCQYYFGVIYETECVWLHWFDKRSTNNWANGRLTELNAGYLDEEMYFEINSYNKWNFQNKRVKCKIDF